MAAAGWDPVTGVQFGGGVQFIAATQDFLLKVEKSLDFWSIGSSLFIQMGLQCPK
jgi:hypothetical protein